MPDKCISSIEEEEPHTTLPDGNDHDNKDDHHCYAYWFFSMKFVLLHLIKETLLLYIYVCSFSIFSMCFAELYIVLFSVKWGRSEDVVKCHIYFG